jgi:PAS domain S-box-containing protein
MLENIGNAVIATDAQGLITFINRVAVKLTGWNEEEAQGKPCQDVFHIVNEKTRLATESPVTKVLRDGVISGLANHTILIARNGTERNIDDSGSPIRDKADSLIGVVLLFRDVTERRKSEKTRQEQQEILQILFDHIPGIATFLDEKRECRWVNRARTHIQTLTTIHDLLVSDVKEGGGAQTVSAQKALESLLPMLQQIIGGSAFIGQRTR